MARYVDWEYGVVFRNARELDGRVGAEGISQIKDPIQQSEERRLRCSPFPSGWETCRNSYGAFALLEGCLGNQALNEVGVHMKNTGKRIFAAVVLFVAVNGVLLVSAGAFASQR